jgi:hypothetical protein
VPIEQPAAAERQTIQSLLEDEWDLPYPCLIAPIDPEDDDEWESLQYSLGRERNEDRIPRSDRPLARCLEVARANRASTLVIETRYVDSDYRSELSAHYSKAFSSYRDATRRVHFFRASDITKENVWQLSAEQAASYLGYIVLRPQVAAVVGRTMLAPPPALKRAIRTAVAETVTLLGQELAIKAVPFMQQDTQLGSCATAAIWMCHYSAHRADNRVARRTVAQLSQLIDPSLGLGRAVPSTGATLAQMSDLLGRSGLPSLYYDLSRLTDDDRPDGKNWLKRRNNRDDQTTRVCCRYLNSGLPVIAIVRHAPGGKNGRVDLAEDGALHAITVCGYHRVGQSVRLIAHDDRRGPYMTYSSTVKSYDELWREHCGWFYLLAPLPEKLWLPGEAAERAGTEFLINAARIASPEVATAATLHKLFDEGAVSFRTFAMTGNRFKRRIIPLITDDVARQAYAEARLPRYVWVVEAIERKARKGERPKCVIAEVVYDATSDERAPIELINRLPGIVTVRQPDDPEWNSRTNMRANRESAGQFDP